MFRVGEFSKPPKPRHEAEMVVEIQFSVKASPSWLITKTILRPSESMLVAIACDNCCVNFSNQQGKNNAYYQTYSASERLDKR